MHVNPFAFAGIGTCGVNPVASLYTDRGILYGDTRYAIEA
jgi:hypothetical protein